MIEVTVVRTNHIPLLNLLVVNKVVKAHLVSQVMSGFEPSHLHAASVGLAHLVSQVVRMGDSKNGGYDLVLSQLEAAQSANTVAAGMHVLPGVLANPPSHQTEHR